MNGEACSPRVGLHASLYGDTVGRVSAVSDVRYFWREARVPDGLEITQVYGYLLCPATGRVLVQDDDGTRNLPGGTPEVWDADLAATLVREAANWTSAALVCPVEEFAPRAPDPDGGRTYRRLMTSLEAAPGVLGWGEPAVLQARAAARVARAQWRLPVDAPAAAGNVD